MAADQRRTGNALSPQQYYERNLPHWLPEGRELFVTWRLAGSLPRKLRGPVGRLIDGRRFVELDQILDSGRVGPVWLKQPEVARMVVGAIDYCAQMQNFYETLAYVVMANHVHLLIGKIGVPLSRITKTLKGYTAKLANEILGRAGQSFWQDESFDHWVRSPAELAKITQYIEYNPVAAGLVSKPEEWAWSSASRSVRELKGKADRQEWLP